ncbi:hypothetical protein TWF718_009872 [Orbilia javanica]|uniref:Uncharacterized protein n=1 Tax=Orbilia javanica TaxID=47235 RepID=A0AAN8MU49_9PEZI
MSQPASDSNGLAKAREYILNCAFLNQLSAGNKNINRLIIERAEEYRMMEHNVRYLTEYRYTTMKKLLDELAILLVARSDEAVAIAVTHLSKRNITLTAAINSGEDVETVYPADQEVFMEGYSHWVCERVEKHAATIFRLAHEFIATEDLDAQFDVQCQFRLVQVEYNIIKISDQFDRIQEFLDDICPLKPYCFTAEDFEQALPSGSEQYYVDPFPSYENARDFILAKRLRSIYLEWKDSSPRVTAILLGREKTDICRLSYRNLHIWHELIKCAFTNTRLALIRIHELKSEGKETEYWDMLRVLCTYFDYIDTFVNHSSVFRTYAGIITKLAAQHKQNRQPQTEASNQENAETLNSSDFREAKEERKDEKPESRKAQMKARQAFRQMFFDPKSMLYNFRHKNTNKPDNNGRRSEQTAEKPRPRDTKPIYPTFKTKNEFFQRCHLLAMTYRRPDRFLSYADSARGLTRRKTKLNVIRPDKKLAESRPGQKLEDFLHRFFHLDDLTEDEISVKVQSFLNFLSAVIPDTQAYRHLLSTLNHGQPVFPTFYHAELILLPHLSPYTLGYPYVGVSRPPCVVCEHLIIKQRRLEVREGSGKVYPLSFPEGISEGDKHLIYRNIKDLTARIVNDICTAQRKRRQNYPGASQAGVNEKSPDEYPEKVPATTNVEHVKKGQY